VTPEPLGRDRATIGGHTRRFHIYGCGYGSGPERLARFMYQPLFCAGGPLVEPEGSGRVPVPPVGFQNAAVAAATSRPATDIWRTGPDIHVIIKGVSQGQRPCRRIAR